MTLWVEARYLYHHPAKFGDHRHCGSGDTMFLLIEEQDSTCLLETALLFISKAHSMKTHGMSC